MSNTSNCDFCVELGIDSVKEIFHLAFKDESRFPHNLPPVTLPLSGQNVTVATEVFDDETRPADLTFADQTHIDFSFPIQLTVQAPDAPDPSLTQVVLEATVSFPGELASWQENGNDVLGVTFFGVTAANVTVPSLTGLPAIDVGTIATAIHSKYATIPHTYTQGSAKLNIYDGSSDPSLTPPNAAVPPDIAVSENVVGATTYLAVSVPLWVSASEFGFTYTSFGHVAFNRQIVQTDTTITIDMSAEPADPTLKTVVTLDNTGIGHDQVLAALTPQIIAAIAQFGTITEPAFSEAAAKTLLAQRAADYIDTRRFPCYSPQSPDPTITVTAPVGYCLVADGVLAILLSPRDSSTPAVPDNFLGGGQLALAAGADFVNERIQSAIKSKYPHLDNGGDEIDTAQGSATLTHLTANLADPGEDGQAQGHIWTAGNATVHIKCWPDPDVSFSGPVFIDTSNTVNPDGSCNLTLQPRAGHFNIGESCCDVFIDLMIPIVGWIMLAIVESTINSVGGQVINQVAGSETQNFAPIPPVVNGIAQVSACLTGLNISRQGFVLPGTISIRRLTRSFGDMQQQRRLPNPNQP